MSKKGWLIGCSGCLGVVLVGVAAVCMIGWQAISGFMAGTESTANQFFGKSVPSSYTPLVTFDFENTKLVLLMNAKSNLLLLGMESPLSENDKAIIQKGDTKALEAFFQEKTKIASYKTGDKYAGDVLENLTLLGVEEMQTETIGTVRALKFRAHGRDKRRGYIPLNVVLLPVEGDRLKILLLLGGKTSSQNPNATFTEDFIWLQQQMKTVIDESKLIPNNSVPPKPLPTESTT